METGTKAAYKSTRNIVILGLISCFADISSEMVYPIVPLYLTAALGATPALVGLIEGVAESLASLLKVFSGYVSDRFRKKKALAFSGYATGVIYKLALLLSSTWAGVLTARVIDRFGKGIRTAPRDVMVAESADGQNIGRAFGIHKMLDMFGSAIGILLAYLILTKRGTGGYHTVFVWSILPVVIALALFFFLKEKKEARLTSNRERFWQNIRRLDRRLLLFLMVIFVFTLGNSSNSFLLLRARDSGYSDTQAILLYFLYNLTASVLALPFGKLSDKIGRKKLLVAGYAVFSAVYLGFAFLSRAGSYVVLFILYGVYTAMTAGVERALVTEVSPKNLKGTMLGLHATLSGIALLPASAIAGLLWTRFGASAPFVYGGVMAALAAMILGLWLKPTKPQDAVS